MDDGWLTYEEVAVRLDVTPRAARSERFGADGRRCKERRSGACAPTGRAPCACTCHDRAPDRSGAGGRPLRAHVETLKAEIETLKGQLAASEERMTKNSEIARSALAVSRSALDDRFHETVFHGTADLLADSSFAIG